MVEVAELFTRLIGFNPKYAPFAKKQVRQAINYAIDSRLIIQKLLKGKAFPCVGYLPPTSPAFDPRAKGYEFNPEKARALMKEAGYEKGFSFECIGTSNESWGVVVVEAIMPFLKRINVTVKPQQLEGAALADRVRRMDFQAFIWSLSSGAGGDPLQALISMAKEITDEMLDVYTVAGTYDEIADKVMQRYDGLLDRVAFYIPYRAGTDDAQWAKLAKRFNG